MKGYLILFQDWKMQLLIAECNSLGSGEILNDTLEGVPTMDGAPITEMGSGDGTFLHVTEEVSEWEI